MTHFAFLQNLGGGEMILIFAVILLLFGAKKLPELARGLGRGVHEFRKARQEFEVEIHRAGEELRLEDERRERELRAKKAEKARQAEEARKVSLAKSAEEEIVPQASQSDQPSQDSSKEAGTTQAVG